MSEHLSASDISVWLSGGQTPVQERHVRDCAGCREALEQRAGALAQFRGMVSNWSERELARTRPPVLPSRQRMFYPGGLRLAAAAAMVVALAAGPIWLRHRAAERAAEIARQDEVLLQQVQAEVSRAVPETMEPLTSMVSWSKESSQ